MTEAIAKAATAAAAAATAAAAAASSCAPQQLNQPLPCTDTDSFATGGAKRMSLQRQGHLAPGSDDAPSLYDEPAPSDKRHPKKQLDDDGLSPGMQAQAAAAATGRARGLLGFSLSRLSRPAERDTNSSGTTS